MKEFALAGGNSFFPTKVDPILEGSVTQESIQEITLLYPFVKFWKKHRDARSMDKPQ